MQQSLAMLEIRKIRDENSLRHLTMTDEERIYEADEALKWLQRVTGRHFLTDTRQPNTQKNPHAE